MLFSARNFLILRFRLSGRNKDVFPSGWKIRRHWFKKPQIFLRRVIAHAVRDGYDQFSQYFIQPGLNRAVTVFYNGRGDKRHSGQIKSGQHKKIRIGIAGEVYFFFFYRLYQFPKIVFVNKISVNVRIAGE